MRTHASDSPRWRRLGVSVVAGAVAVLALPAGAAHADSVGEFEGGYIWPEANGRYISDATAGGGAAAEMWGASSNDLSVYHDDATSAYRIRARQIACGPAPVQASLKVDGVVAGTFSVVAGGWTDYTISGDWAAGWRLLHVDLTNPYESSTCKRTLALDRVTAVSAYYVDAAGNDGNDGRSPATAWRSVDKVNAATLEAGATVLFKRGQTFGNVNLVADDARVTYGAYGAGALPVLDGGGGATHTVDVRAPFVTVQDLLVRNGGDDDKVGIAVWSTDAVVRRVTATGNAIGVQAQAGADRLRVTGSTLSDNTTVIQPDGENDDYGACGVSVLAADHVEIDHNTFTGNVGRSDDFGLDGSAVELFGGTDTAVHHNRATDNHTFSELGNAATANTHFYDNLVLTSASGPSGAYGFNVQGSDGPFGGVRGTRITNNTIVMRSAEPGPVVVGPDADVVLHNNIVQAITAGYTEEPIDEGHNVYFGHNYNGIKSSATPGGNAPAPSSVTADPLFVSATDHHLQSASPARDHGVNAYGVTTDLDDHPRAVGAVDAGAFEHQ